MLELLVSVGRSISIALLFVIPPLVVVYLTIMTYAIVLQPQSVTLTDTEQITALVVLAIAFGIAAVAALWFKNRKQNQNAAKRTTSMEL